MRHWQVVAVSHDDRPPGKVVRTIGLAAETRMDAWAKAVLRIGPAAYGATFTITEIPPPHERLADAGTARTGGD